jgi:hypothetical protein
MCVLRCAPSGPDARGLSDIHAYRAITERQVTDQAMSDPRIQSLAYPMHQSSTTLRVLYHPLDPNAFCVLTRGADWHPFFHGREPGLRRAY